MKKLLCALLMITLFAQTAIASEITFRDIPWGSNVDSVLSMLYGSDWQEGYLISEAYISPLGNGFFTEEFGESYCFNGGFEWKDLRDSYFVVAGHNVAYTSFTFTYGIEDGVLSLAPEDSQLVKAEYTFGVTDKFLVYNDLKTKLTSLYGEPKLLRTEEPSFNFDTYAECTDIRDACLWYGENNTAVLLSMNWKTSDGVTEEKFGYIGENAIYLSYAKTDIPDRIDIINECLKQEAVRTEQETVSQNTNNTDGL